VKRAVVLFLRDPVSHSSVHLNVMIMMMMMMMMRNGREIVSCWLTMDPWVLETAALLPPGVSQTRFCVLI